MSNLKRDLLPILTFIKIDVRRLFRDKVAIFFVFVFPLIFLLIFGSIFGNDGGGFSVRVALINQSQTAFAKDFEKQLANNKVFEIDKEITSLDKAKEKMSRGQLDATMIMPANFGQQTGQYPTGQLRIVYGQTNQQAGSTLTSIMEGIFKDLNARYVTNQEPFTVKPEAITTKGLRAFDYTFAGIMGFTLLSLGIFGPTTVFPRLKQRGVLRRYRTTTLKVWQYFIGNVISNAIIGLIALVMMFVAAVVVFDLSMRGNYLTLALVVLLGTMMLFGIGLAIGGWAKNENQAAPLAQLVTLPMMFLSGVFFPTFLMPELLQSVTQFIPLTPIIDSIRLVITENATPLDLAPQFGIMLGWLVIMYAVAFRVFRWE